jgi:hypothetical protein
VVLNAKNAFGFIKNQSNDYEEKKDFSFLFIADVNHI